MTDRLSSRNGEQEPKGDFRPCPFCGKKPDASDPDTIYPTGTVWRFEPDIGFRTYHSLRDRKEGDGVCYGMHCPTDAGGCGAEIHGDSLDEVVCAWNRRASLPSETVALERFKPMGDNHHNAMLCPYCNPSAPSAKMDSTSIPSQRLASSEARPDTTPDEPVNGETHQRRVAPRSGSGEGVSQADGGERPAPPFARSSTGATENPLREFVAAMAREYGPEAGDAARDAAQAFLLTTSAPSAPIPPIIVECMEQLCYRPGTDRGFEHIDYCRWCHYAKGHPHGADCVMRLMAPTDGKAKP